MIKKGEDILYIEDEQYIRGVMLERTEEDNFKNVEAPASAQECEELLSKKKYHTAFIDFKLTDWKGPIILGGKERKNGVEIAQYLHEKFPEMLIGLFSTHETELGEEFKKANFKSNVYIASQKEFKAARTEMFLSESVRNFFEFEIELRPVTEEMDIYPPEIQIFLAKRMLHIEGPGAFRWKNNIFRWKAFCNKSFDGSGVKMLQPDAIPTSKPERFIFKVDPEEYYVNYFENEKIQLERDLRKLSKFLTHINEATVPGNNLIPEIVAGEFITSMFWEKKLSAGDAAKMLTALSVPAQLQSQKYLYKNIHHKKGFHSETKEDVYTHLAPFIDRGLPQVLEVFHSQINSIEGDKANVIMKSKGPEQVIRNQPFDFALLQKYGIGMHTPFEYTMFKSYKNQHGVGNHIEII